MVGKRGRISDRFVAALAIWIVAVGAIIPSLDRDLLASGTVIESGGHESCPRPHHDHTICIQFGKLGWSNGPSAPLAVSPPAASEFLAARDDVLVESLRGISTHSRAPPHIT